MRFLLSLRSWLVLLLSAAAAGLLCGDPIKDAAADRLAALIKQFNDDEFNTREAASKALTALGEKALPALRKAVAGSEELDFRRRGEELIQTILLAARKSKSIGLVTVLIDAGDFQMGSPGTEAFRRPDELQHRVRITKPFLLGAYEVTQDEYQKVMKTNPSSFASTGAGKDKVARKETSQYPVETVTWFDAIDFCNRLSKQDGYEPYCKLASVKREADSIKSASVTIAGGNGYRLPTEAEWEYACRATSITPFHFGVGNTGREANIKSGIGGGYGGPPAWASLGRTTKVGSYNSNRWGLYDMHGNAGEWCWDWYDKDYYGNAPVNDPQGPDRGQHRVLRGGSWLVNEGNCRSASRFFLTPDDSKDYAGFRVARTP